VGEWTGRLTSLGGLVGMVALAWVLGEQRRRVRLRPVATGLGLQLVFAVVVLRLAPGRAFFEGAKRVFDVVLGASAAGAEFLFGRLVSDVQIRAMVAFQVLPIVIFVSALAGVLYHVGVIQAVVRVMARVMRWAMDTSGAESLACALFVFLGIEATTAIAEYIRRMTRSELFTLMTAFMATIAGSVMGAYALFIGVENAGHLLAASVMSAPAAIAVAKIMVPETEEPLTRGAVRFEPPREAANVIDAAARGAAQGLNLALQIGAMLIAFVGLVALVNLVLAGVTGRWMAEPLTLQRLLGYAFSPLAAAMGVPWADAATVGELLGTKTVLNEFLAYERLQGLVAAGRLAPRSVLIATYALCGFANFGSVAILIGGLGGIDPDRRSLVARLGLRSIVSGTLACFLTACVAGMLH